MNRAERRRRGLNPSPAIGLGGGETAFVSDSRVAYGFRCAWWDTVTNAASKPSGLPCCPHCGGVLMEVPSETEWWAGVERHEAAGNPGYRAFVTWLRGRCYPTVAEARAAFQARGEEPQGG